MIQLNINCRKTNQFYDLLSANYIGYLRFPLQTMSRILAKIPNVLSVCKQALFTVHAQLKRYLSNSNMSLNFHFDNNLSFHLMNFEWRSSVRHYISTWIVDTKLVCSQIYVWIPVTVPMLETGKFKRTQTNTMYWSILTLTNWYLLENSLATVVGTLIQLCGPTFILSEKHNKLNWFHSLWN